MWITTQLFRNAFVMACISTMLFPAAFSPDTTSLVVFFSAAASSMRPHTFTVSGRTRVCGLWNRLHVWLDLKASLARSWSMVDPGIFNTLPALSGSERLFSSMTDSPSTGIALLLVSTMRLRHFLRSPCSGRLWWTISFLSLNLASFMRLPRRWWTPAWGLVGLVACAEAVVENWCAAFEGIMLVVDVVGGIIMVNEPR